MASINGVQVPLWLILLPLLPYAILAILAILEDPDFLGILEIPADQSHLLLQK